ncbi:ATP-dependent helicase [Flavitalea sp. BT771]|uniref:ATP-dependent helicase n=1 Tax=Flavitalea sp. BT771 TaxID=3063329 RepID=UPI0026E1D991|nr:ATP-dependent helicase [Flavitalea sp. BT771]MDO6433113.1 ATP-dependent helicase [Flavitalea sp. BT771]MDV6221611.1 ATP-dependent helicase [Flavitalea sp. BT771]
MLHPVKAEQYLSELEMIRKSRADLTPRMIALAKLFDRLVKSITADERMVFRNFYARFRYLLATLPMRDVEQRNLENFRRLVNEGDESKVNEKALEQGIMLLKNVVAMSLGGAVVRDEGFREGYFTRLYPKRNYAKLTELRLLCSSWTEMEDLGGKQGFVLHAYDLKDLEEAVQVRVRKEEHYDYTVIRSWLKEDAVLHVQHVRALGDGTNSYETTFDTLITLEPDFLVDATEIGECYTFYGANSDLFFLNRLVSDLTGAAALKGSIIGYYLDELVRDPNQDKNDIYRAAMKQHAMKAAQLGRTEMLAIHRSIHTEHLPNIVELVRREKKKDIWIEPTYFSTDYGLQGRLDLLCKNEDTRTQDIIELKSGSSPNPNPNRLAFPNHKMQVVCYDMMLESTYGKDRKGFNAVFYSKCPDSPYRNLVSEHLEKRQVLQERNEIVAHIYQLAGGDFSVLQRIKNEGVRGLPVFKETILAQFRASYEPGRIATEYYQQMIAFLLREFINTKVGHQLKEEQEDQLNGFAGLWLDTRERKEDDFRVIYDLETVEIKEGLGYIRLKFTKKIDHAFRKGDLVILYPKMGEHYEALHHHILKGSLDEIHQDSLVVCLNNKQTDYNFIKTYSHWAVEPDIFERNYWSGIACLFNVLTASARKKRVLFGHEQPVFVREARYSNDSLTLIQQTSIQQALDARDYYLLQGPPGTGKTSTFLVHYVRESLLRTSDKRVVVLAFTNKAVDKICEHFRHPRQGAPVSYLRLGSRYTEDEFVFSRQIQGDNPDNWRKVIDGHRVFVSTVTTFHNNWQLLRQFIPFSEVIVDEASQLTEAVLSSVLVLFDKFVLIGDHKQLPAVITQDDSLCKIESVYLNKLGIADLRKSLFERLVENATSKQWLEAYGQLRDHYRMHEDIASLISRHYRAGLEAALEAQRNGGLVYELPAGHFLRDYGHHRVLFVETPSEGGPKRNEKEALIAATIANALVGAGVVQPSEIGIITPFRAQIAAIKEHLRDGLLENEAFIIDTVERYQGDERKIIIFSTTISDARQIRTIQSVAEDEVSVTDRKLLVSISRAVDQLIILGNSAALGRSELYGEMIGQIKERGGYFEGMQR